MELILLERVEKLGQMGDIVKVKPGYARNFLLPQHKALRATEDNKRTFDAQRVQLEARNLERRQDADAVSGKMEGQRVILVRQAGEAGQLYGSVNARDISDALTTQGFTVQRRQVELEQPIKTIGIHPVRVRLHPEVVVNVTVNVARSPDEAEIQERTGRAMIGMDEDRNAPRQARYEEEAAPAEDAVDLGAAGADEAIPDADDGVAA